MGQCEYVHYVENRKQLATTGCSSYICVRKLTSQTEEQQQKTQTEKDTQILTWKPELGKTTWSHKL